MLPVRHAERSLVCSLRASVEHTEAGMQNVVDVGAKTGCGVFCRRMPSADRSFGVTLREDSPHAVMNEKIGERHASACRYKYEVPGGNHGENSDGRMIIGILSFPELLRIQLRSLRLKCRII